MERAKKDCILLEAAKAFARFGFKKASIDDIAKGAGVAKGTVYLAAESKEDLFYQVLHREVRDWVAECSKVIDRRTPADRQLGDLIRVSMEHLEKHPLVRGLLFGQTTEMLPAWAARFAELRTLGQANVIEVLRLGIKQNRFRDDLDIETIASLLQDLEIATYLFHGRGEGASAKLSRRARVGLDLVLLGIVRR